MTTPYDDIMNQPHHVSRNHLQMPMADRAAQFAPFAPFAALTGYESAVEEVARQTVERRELDAQEQRAINECLAFIVDHIKEQPEVRIQYFVPDEHKSGGAIIEVSGKVKKISATDGTIVMADGCKIKTAEITSLAIR